MNWISFPSRVRPIRMSISPASRPDSSRPFMPCLAKMGARMTMNAAVGPVTCVREPPSSATTKPATIAVYSPCWGAAPTAMASAIDSGSATTPTTTPAIRSARRSALP
jgi:hypothetical protein